MQFFKILNCPPVYRLAQWLLAPGAESSIARHMADILKSVPEGDPILDVGCGPKSWLNFVGRTPIGIDVEPNYVAAYLQGGGTALVGSADSIPFGDETFVGVWCVGVFHHLPDEVVAKAVREMLRVCRAGGYVAILDAVLPRSAFRAPVPALIRSLDRGRHMRREEELRHLLEQAGSWDFSRFRYAATGLEMLASVHR